MSYNTIQYSLVRCKPAIAITIPYHRFPVSRLPDAWSPFDSAFLYSPLTVGLNYSFPISFQAAKRRRTPPTLRPSVPSLLFFNFLAFNFTPPSRLVSCSYPDGCCLRPSVYLTTTSWSLLFRPLNFGIGRSNWDLGACPRLVRTIPTAVSSQTTTHQSSPAPPL